MLYIAFYLYLAKFLVYVEIATSLYISYIQKILIQRVVLFKEQVLFLLLLHVLQLIGFSPKGSISPFG